MTGKFRCGHIREPILLGDNMLGLIAWQNWNEDQVESKKLNLCFRCWLEKYDFPHRADMEKINGEWVHMTSQQKYINEQELIDSLGGNI